MISSVDNNPLQVTPEDVDYFRRFKPLHYLTLQEMIRHGEARIVRPEEEGFDDARKN